MITNYSFNLKNHLTWNCFMKEDLKMKKYSNLQIFSSAVLGTKNNKIHWVIK